MEQVRVNGTTVVIRCTEQMARALWIGRQAWKKKPDRIFIVETGRDRLAWPVDSFLLAEIK
jgi:hypothetical protein